ncbi:hypothetical protein ACL07V_29880 [Streptomyces sp. MB22_4]|uniref:hypothetical protein n=1 Tax=Streptomyces sp. MB22_4 TaxID=3383120 RepID=UPI00399FB0FD
MTRARLFNESDTARPITTTASAVGLPAADGYPLRDLWQHTGGRSDGAIAATVPAHGTVLLRVRAGADRADRRPGPYRYRLRPATA